MNRMTKLLTLGVAAIIVLGYSPQIFATCSGISQPALQQGTVIADCPDKTPVGGFLAVVGQAGTINNNGIDPICEDQTFTSGDGVQCSSLGGVAGDNVVAIQFDWGNTANNGTLGPNGCPNSAGAPGIGRNFIQILCNNGASVILTVAYDTGLAGYPFDYATKLDPIFPAAAHATIPNTLTMDGPLVQAGGTDKICVNQVSAPTIYSDCDGDSVAGLSGIICPDTTPAVGLSSTQNIYTFSGPRGVTPNDLRIAQWTLVTPTTGPNGTSKCATFTTPPAGNCTWVGTPLSVGGQDTGAIGAMIADCPKVAGDPTATTDKVKIDSAAFKQGTLHVDFSTESESLIVGFNVYAGSTKLNTGLIAAKGTGSNAYSFEVGRGAVKSNKTVTVEAVKSDSTVVKTAPVTLK